MTNEQTTHTHTPGPWEWFDDGDGSTDCEPPEPGKRWLSIKCDGDEVAVIVNRTTEPTERQCADARLIAAAPDLLTAARLVVQSWVQGDLALAVTELNDAIERATGERV